jgi:membrane protein YdbS with pleckstrin-like domain
MELNYFCGMLTDDELRFVQYWEKHKALHSTFTSKLLRGLPMAFVFGLPILLLILCVYLFLPEWYTKISKTSSATFVVVVIAVLIAIVFYAFIRMHFKWEMNDQQYKELKAKEKK